MLLLHFARVVDDANWIVATRVCVSVCPRPHAYTIARIRIELGGVVGMPLVVHYWADLQSVHGLRCYGNITRILVTSANAKR